MNKPARPSRQPLKRVISDRKTDALALKLNVHLLDNATDFIFLRDLKGNFVYVNETALSALGYSREEFMKLNVEQTIAPGYSWVKGHLLKELEAKGEVTFETASLRRDGSTLPVEVHAKFIESDGKKLVFSTVRDITERKKAEEELRLKEQILDSGTDFIFLRDRAGNCLYVNETALHALGYTREEFMKLRIEQIIALGHPWVKGHLVRELEKTGKATIESAYRRKDGTIIPVETHARFIESGGKTLILSAVRDISERKKAEVELRLKEQILDKSSDSILLRDHDGKIVYANEVAYTSRGYTREEFLGMNIRQLLATIQPGVFEARSNEIWEKGTAQFESNHKRKDGSLMPIEVNMSVLESGGKKFIIAVNRDITERKKAEEELRLKERILDSATDAVFLRNADGKMLYVNEIACMSLGYTREELMGMNIRQLLVPNEADLLASRAEDMLKKETITFESTQLHKNGSLIPVEVKASAIESGGQKLFLAVIRDITEGKKMEEYIKQLAYHDTLTGLPNRALFHDHFVLAQAHAIRYQHMLALLMMDLDHFKDVNDSLGHEAGDRLLKEIGNRLTGIVRKIDTVARMGGDEFVLLLPEVNREEDAVAVAQKVVEALRQPFTFKNTEIKVTTSLGMAIYPVDGSDQDTLLSNADSAMYRAKREGQNIFLRYNQDKD